MLYALADPASFVLLLLSFVVAATLHGWVSSMVATRVGERGPRSEGRTVPDPRRHLDPFGAVAAAIAGIGWGKPVDAPDRRRAGARVATLVSGPVVVVVVGLCLLVGYRLAGGPPVPGGLSAVVQRGVSGDLLLAALLLSGVSHLFVGLLSLVPVPPLHGGALLFGLAPRTAGWQKAEYQLSERGIGVAVLLVLLLIPLGGPQALLPTLLDLVVAPLAQAAAGG